MQRLSFAALPACVRSILSPNLLIYSTFLFLFDHAHALRALPFLAQRSLQQFVQLFGIPYTILLLRLLSSRTMALPCPVRVVTSYSSSSQEPERSLHPYHFPLHDRHQNIQSVQVPQLVEPLKLTPSRPSARLSEQGWEKPVLPRLHSAVQTRDPFSSVSSRHRGWEPSFSPPTTDNTGPMLLQSLSPLPDDENAEDDWVGGLSTRELQYQTNQFSSRYPLYITDERSPGPGKGGKKRTGLKNPKHANNERVRRLKHRSYVAGQYEQCSDCALSKAGWRLDSSKPPMKEQIMRARRIQGKMERRLNLLQNQHIVQLEQENDRLRRQAQMCKTEQKEPERPSTRS